MNLCVIHHGFTMYDLEHNSPRAATIHAIHPVKTAPGYTAVSHIKLLEVVVWLDIH